MKKSTRDRFKEYIDREEEVMSIIQKYTALGAEIVKVNPAPDGETYDRVVVLPTREVKLEIQITEPDDFQKYGDVRLDLISAYLLSKGSPSDVHYAGKSRIKPCNTHSFLSGITVKRYGKLYLCEAETLAFYVPEPAKMLWLYSVAQLQKNRWYFVSKYGIMVNKKDAEETWESCFVAVPESDRILQSCGVKAI